ncbi:MAG: aminotransferase class I/II-fold pyridoxal phosphate-dependent enzyme [Gammaproteobacteria bacterium]|nr:aminotransferase class I/II-fold pyridoxal phosphate-dependent enzyme [Gammaproteobacteria bacterium]
MNLLSKFDSIREEREEVSSIAGHNPFNFVIDEILSSTEAMVNGKPTILAGTNNYLGMTFDADCIRAARNALENEGTGTTGSRMANGTYSDHLALEKEFADYFDYPAAILFSTGYMANLSVLSTICSSNEIIVIDSDCHASIYDACRMSDAEVIRFRHNNPVDLDRRLKRLGERAKSALVVTEGIYSMLGDQAPLKEIVEVKNRYNAMLLVDEAHSLGVLGDNGRGLSEQEGVEDQVDFIVGTFSKSLGSIGGFCVSRWPEIENMRYAMRPYIFTASSSPALIASTRKALEKMRDGRHLRDQLWDNAGKLYQGLKDLGLTIGPATSPVVAVILDSGKLNALSMWAGLLDCGVYVNIVLPPATPGGECLLRCSVSAAHSPEQIAAIVDAFAKNSQYAQLQ